MGFSFNPRFLILARQARGITQAEISNLSQINQGFVSKIENGIKEPSTDTIKRFSEILKFPVSFFYQQEEVYGLPLSVHPFMHRKKSTVTIRGLDMIHAQTNITIMNLKHLLNSVSLTFNNVMPYMDIDEYGEDVEKIAELTRRTWLLPRGPIQNVTDYLEKAGCIVIWSDFDNIDIDGLTLHINNLPYCIFVNINRPSDRMRFTLCHELGHIIMHRSPCPDMENQATKFASAFLMPAYDIKESLTTFSYRITLETLAHLKPIWKVSMQALLMRITDLGLINKTQREYLWKRINIARIRLREPPELDLPYEEPKLLPRILKLHLEDLGYSVSELSKAVNLYDPDFSKNFGLNEKLSKPNHLRLVS